jgi:HSP20 family protein
MDIVRRRRDQGRPLGRLRDEVNDLFGRFFEDWDWPLTAAGGAWPAVDLADTDAAVVVKAELPGVKGDDIDIAVLGNTLTISGEKTEADEDKGENYYHVERRYGSFRRDIPLPAGVDPDKVEANYRDGVLTVTLPKSEQAKPKRIEVKKK